GEMVLAVDVVAVVRGEQWRLQLLRDGEQLRVGLALRGEAVVLQLDEEVVAPEDVLQAGRLLERALVVAPQQRLQDVTAEAARRRDESLAVALERLPVGARLVVEA